MTVLDWMLYCLALSVLFSAVGWLVERGVHRTRLPTRWIWAGTMLASVLLPLLAIGLEQGAVGPDSAQALSATVVAGEAAGIGTSTEGGFVDAVSAVVRDGGALVSAAVVAVSSRIPDAPGTAAWVVGLWLTVSLLLGGLVLASHVRLRRRARRWSSRPLAGRSVRVSARFGPAALGALRPSIVVPHWILTRSPDEVQLIVDHEAEHVGARDPLLLSAGLALVVTMPWNPVLWLQLRRLRDAVEMDCDRRVLARGASAGRYGGLLFELGRRSHRDVLPALAITGSPSLLERRLKALKKRSTRMAVPSMVLAFAAAIGIAVVACEAEPPQGPAAVTEANEGDSSLEIRSDSIVSISGLDVGASGLRIYVDGVEVESGEIELSRSDIESIEVIRGDATGGSERTIRIETNGGEGERDPSETADPAPTASGPAPAPGAEPTPTPDAEPTPEPTTAPAPNPIPAPNPAPAPNPIPAPNPAPAPDPSQDSADLSDAPRFTPFTAAPDVLNRDEVAAALESAYPSELRDAGIGGTTFLQFFITADGQVENIVISESSGNERLDRAALDVGRAFEFTPALNRDEPVPVWIMIPVTFQGR